MEMETVDSTNPDIDEPPPSYPGSFGYHESVMTGTELYRSEPPPPYPGTAILDTSSGSPPPYTGGTTNQPAVVTELEPSGNESSPSHPGGSSRAISQPDGVTPAATSQTSRQGDFTDKYWDLFLCCAICFLCGSPLTLLCILPAILLNIKGDQYSSNGEAVKARKVKANASVLYILGVASGLAIMPILYMVLLPVLVIVYS